MKLVRISRPLLRPEHDRLRANIPTTNRLGDLSIKWRALGNAGLTLVDRGEFQRAIERPDGHLAAEDTTELGQELNQGILATRPYAARLTAPVIDVDFFGEGQYRSIAYVLESEQLLAEHADITAELGRRNGINSGWRAFEPHVTLATIPAVNMAPELNNTIWTPSGVLRLSNLRCCQQRPKSLKRYDMGAQSEGVAHKTKVGKPAIL